MKYLSTTTRLFASSSPFFSLTRRLLSSCSGRTLPLISLFHLLTKKTVVQQLAIAFSFLSDSAFTISKFLYSSNSSFLPSLLLTCELLSLHTRQWLSSTPVRTKKQSLYIAKTLSFTLLRIKKIFIYCCNCLLLTCELKKSVFSCSSKSSTHLRTKNNLHEYSNNISLFSSPHSQSKE